MKIKRTKYNVVEEVAKTLMSACHLLYIESLDINLSFDDYCKIIKERLINDSVHTQRDE